MSRTKTNPQIIDVKPVSKNAQRIAELKDKLELNARVAAEFAKQHPVQAAGIATGVGFSIYGMYRLITG